MFLRYKITLKIDQNSSENLKDCALFSTGLKSDAGSMQGVCGDQGQVPGGYLVKMETAVNLGAEPAGGG